jgi:uncharacterized protein
MKNTLIKTIFRRLAKTIFVVFILFNVLIAFQAYRTSYFYEQGEVPFKRMEDRTTAEKIESALLGVKLSKRTITTFPAFPYDTVFLKDSEGYRLEAWYVPADSAKGTVILFHGHGSCKGANVGEANYFHNMGYHTFAIDVRSHGNSEGNHCSVGYEEAENVKLAYDWVQAKGEKNIILWGSSMGAAMTLKAVHDFQLKPQKVILNCPFATMQDAVKGFLRKAKLPTSPLAEMLMFWGSVEHGYWGFNYKPADYASKITMPVLLQWGRLDDRVSIDETNRIFNNLGAKDKKLVIYETCGHESYRNRETEKWQTEISDFLASKKE